VKETDFPSAENKGNGWTPFAKPVDRGTITLNSTNYHSMVTIKSIKEEQHAVLSDVLLYDSVLGAYAPQVESWRNVAAIAARPCPPPRVAGATPLESRGTSDWLTSHVEDVTYVDMQYSAAVKNKLNESYVLEGIVEPDAVSNDNVKALKANPYTVLHDEGDG